MRAWRGSCRRAAFLGGLWALGGAWAAAEQRHAVVSRDTLWGLAHQYYQDPHQWPRIAAANPAPSVRDPHWIYPGQVLVIPDLGSPSDPASPPVQEEIAPAPIPAPVQAVVPSRQPVPPAAAFRPDASDDTVTVPDSLSTRFPDGLISQRPSAFRMMALAGWKEEGEVLELEEGRIMAAQGDWVRVGVRAAGVKLGDRLLVFRKAGPTEADLNQDATYLSKIGLIELRRRESRGVYRALVLKTNDTVQPGDLLRREP